VVFVLFLLDVCGCWWVFVFLVLDLDCHFLYICTFLGIFLRGNIVGLYVYFY
jgi:hypothetical protein